MAIRRSLHALALRVYRFYDRRIYDSHKNLRGTSFLRRNMAEAVARINGAKFYSKGENVLEKDWDNLIVLDAGRPDILEDLLGVEVETMISKNSSSNEWMQANFKGEHQDIVMVTGNPFIHKFREEDPEEIFRSVYDAWDYNYNNSFLEPEAVNAAVKDAMRENQGKRTMIHYMQPHFPMPEGKGPEKGSWDAVRTGEITRHELKELYRKNYIKALKEGVLPVMERLDGKTVITADHGQLLGEHGIYGHPPYVKVKQLIEVPWLQLDDEVLESIEKLEHRLDSKDK